MEQNYEGGTVSKYRAEKAAYENFVSAMEIEEFLFEKLNSTLQAKSRGELEVRDDSKDLLIQFENAMQNSRSAFDQWREQMEANQSYREQQA